MWPARVSSLLIFPPQVAIQGEKGGRMSVPERHIIIWSEKVEMDLQMAER